MSVDLHVNDYGTVLEFTVKDQDDNVLDLSEATVKSLVFSKPDGTTSTVTLNFTTDGADGKVQYTIESGLLDVAGTWRMQVVLTLSAGVWYSGITEMKVEPNL